MVGNSERAGEDRGRILLVDDDQNLCDAYARLLRRSGCSVEIAHSGQAAVELLPTADFDIIVADINMSGMTGIQFLRAVRERELHLPVTLMTGDPVLETAVEAGEVGAYRYLTKPLSVATLGHIAGIAIHRNVMASILADRLPLQETCRRMVVATGERLGWDFAVTWTPGDRHQLCCAETWIHTPLRTQACEEVFRINKPEEWRGLAARVWAACSPEWVADLATERDLHQSEWAAAAGLRSGFAVPIGAEGKVLAVLEFFSRAAQAPDLPLLGLFAASAAQLGAHLLRQRTEEELSCSQHLASVGTLAAGVAHEVNTPVQFVNDSVQFLRDATTDVLAVVKTLQAVRELASGVRDNAPLQAAIAAALECEASADLTYLAENVPKAFERCLDGLVRITTIVRSMKEFSYQSQQTMAPADLNRAVQNTLTVARNEYKYVADLRLEFGEVPPVVCDISAINQVVLNLVVNAAHAVGDVVRATEKKGTITIRTRQDGDDVVIEVEDDGGGIPAAIGSRIFEPFFTTKGVGKGTGQGLALARTIVQEKHDGSLTFQSTPEQGTIFTIRLPVAGTQTKDLAS